MSNDQDQLIEKLARADRSVFRTVLLRMHDSESLRAALGRISRKLAKQYTRIRNRFQRHGLLEVSGAREGYLSEKGIEVQAGVQWILDAPRRRREEELKRVEEERLQREREQEILLKKRVALEGEMAALRSNLKEMARLEVLAQLIVEKLKGFRT